MTISSTAVTSAETPGVGAVLLQEIERLGGNIAANASREQMSYTIDCLKVSHNRAALRGRASHTG
jgi:predicted Zn-dependent peptidase